MTISFDYEIISNSTDGSSSFVRLYNITGGSNGYSISKDGAIVSDIALEQTSYTFNNLSDATYTIKVKDTLLSDFKEEIITISSRIDSLYNDYSLTNSNKSADLNINDLFEIKEYPIIFYVYNDSTIESNIIHLEKNDGFKLDLTLPLDASSQESTMSVEDATGGYIYSAAEGFDNDSYISNTLNGCELISVNEIDKKFIPEISIGEYTINQHNQRLYSDKSITVLLESNQYVSLDEIFYPEIKIYKRDNNFNNIPYINYIQDLEIDDSRYNFTLENKTITISNKAIPSVSINMDLFNSLSDDNKILYVKKTGENKGFGNGKKRIFYSQYFPISEPIIFKINSETITQLDSNLIKINPYKGFIYLDQDTLETDEYYIFYNILPRLDYEYSLDNDIRSNYNMDLRAIKNQNQTGMVCINYEEKNIKKIKLNQEKHLDEYLTFKPKCNIGVDSLILNALVLNANNNPVEEVPVTFKIETLPNEDGENGYLNDSSFIDGVVDYSNNEGISRCIYYAAYREDSLLRSIDSMAGASINITSNEAERVDVNTFFNNEVFLYYIRNIDALSNFDFYTNDKDYVIFYERFNNVYRPISPVSIEQNQDLIRFTYSQNFSNSITKDQLKLYAPKYIKITASALDPATGENIVSNPLFIKLVFPNYLKGTIITNGAAAYLGYGMPPQQNDLGTGLGGANYLTINPNDVYSRMSNTITIENE